MSAIRVRLTAAQAMAKLGLTTYQARPMPRGAAALHASNAPEVPPVHIEG